MAINHSCNKETCRFASEFSRYKRVLLFVVIFFSCQVASVASNGNRLNVLNHLEHYNFIKNSEEPGKRIIHYDTLEIILDSISVKNHNICESREVLSLKLPEKGKKVNSLTVVSIPDFLNVDTEFPQPGWEESLDIFLSSVKAENPDLLIIPGDMVMGYWDKTREGIDYWADKYYSAFKERLDRYSFKYIVAVGDHEIGDNNWDSNKARKVPEYKKAFARNFNIPLNGPDHYKGTSYFVVENNILFIMIDVFLNDLTPGSETCEAVIDYEQLSWMTKVIDDHSKVEHIIVAGHVPVLAPVRKFSSSGITLKDGVNSGFWKLLKEKKVDFYLSGEVHDVTCYFDLPVIQIVHGGLFGYNNRVNYMVMKFAGGEVQCTVKEFNLECSGKRMWQTGRNRPSENIKIDPTPVIKGQLITSKNKNENRIILEKGVLSRSENTRERIADDQRLNTDAQRNHLKKINADEDVSTGRFSIENNLLRVSFYPSSGTFALFDKTKNIQVFKNALFKFDDYISSDKRLIFNCLKSNDNKSLEISGVYENGVTIFLTLGISEGSGVLFLTPSIKNDSKQAIIVRNIHVISDAQLYPGERLQKVQLLDGNGGGEITHMRNQPYCISRNNLLLTGIDGDQRVSLTLGGLSYEYFEKFASVHSSMKRKDHLTEEMKQYQLSLQAYLNAGTDKIDHTGGGITLSVEQGKPVLLQNLTIPELSKVILDPNEVIIRADGLNPLKAYTFGFSWIDEISKRHENVLVADASNPDKKFIILSNHSLPSVLHSDTAVYNVPVQAYRSGNMKIFFQNVHENLNTVVSEIWINEGIIDHNSLNTRVDEHKGNELIVNLYANDPVGKRVNPGESFLFEKDRFYLDAINPDPFVSLENYASALKKEQKINIRPYTFPTVCLWYASHLGFGGEGAAVNDSRGAVKEMQHIKESGFLKYSTVAVRLVPDSYHVPNNEQGWWDDIHWQKYGSGGGVDRAAYNVKVEGGHYKPPYETTAKWAGTVTKLGGIPLIYSQTGVRSQDYADSFPGHMLFNEPNRKARNYRPNPDKVTYDFTDPGFIKHMQDVYSNLRKSGIQGLMFDYIKTGWADYGGFEDSSKTTAWAYRNIFKLAYDGLNRDSSLIDVNWSFGSEITLGIAASQRVWSDTDGMIPEMITRCGLRWYKNRVVIAFDTDSKSLLKFRDISRDKLRQVMTMGYVTTGRFIVGNSFSLLSKEVIYDLSRVYPYHQVQQSARPVDAFINYFPSVYDFKVNESWHQITLYNTHGEGEKCFDVNLRASNLNGGLNLNPLKEYYAYDFWNQKFVGKLSGNSTLKQTLRKDEARMISIHEVQDNPQFISTDRHIMQGFLDLEKINWNNQTKELSGTAKVIADEVFKVIIAGNGYDVLKFGCKDNSVKVTVSKCENPGMYELEILSSGNLPVDWHITFSK